MEDKSWINEKIEIDFPLPKTMQNIIESLEKTNSENDYCYFDFLEELDCFAKELVVRGEFTKRQWDILLQKFQA